MTADDVIAAARSCLGTPFQHQGRIKGLALDCAGLAISVADDLGIVYQDVQGYSRLPVRSLLQSALIDQPELKRVETCAMAPGDILLMRFGRHPQHLALYTGSTIIHSYEAAGFVCEHDLSDEWRQRIVAVYRFRVLENRGLKTEDRLVSAPEGAQVVLSSVLCPLASEK
jgi:cell wall-associated NlpC family hydrolase